MGIGLKAFSEPFIRMRSPIICDLFALICYFLSLERMAIETLYNRTTPTFFSPNFYAQMVRAKMARNLLSPIKKNTDGWRDVVLVASLYNPFETFVMMQFAFYISKIHETVQRRRFFRSST
jgi:hypothetical protein